MKKAVLWVYALVFAGFTVTAKETGKPFMSLYPSYQTGGHPQNWAISQDNRGIMYIGNGYGIQEFDGSAWRMIRIPNGSFVRSFAKDSSGCIFVGSATELGYLRVKEGGSTRYISLLNQIPPADRDFNFIWSIHDTPRGIYFQAREKLFLFQQTPGNGADSDNWKVHVWRPDSPENYFVHSFYLDHTLFVLKRGAGLMKMVGDSLRLIKGSEQFGNDRIHVMLHFPGKSGCFLLGTLNRGLFLYDGEKFLPFRTEADELLKQGTLYDGKVLPDGYIALGTLSRGFIIINPDGKLKLHLLKESGLLSNAVTSIFIDRQKNIWLGMSGGVGILEYNSGLSQFPFPSGGVPFDVYRHHGILYASATDGVYFLDKEDSQFKYVPGMKNSGASNSLVMNRHLYAANAAGVYMINNAKASLVLPYSATTPAFICLHRSRLDSNLIFGGSISGLSILKFDPMHPSYLKLECHVKGVHEYIRQIVEMDPGTLWLSTYNSGVIRLHFRREDIGNPVIEHFGTEENLPIGITSVFHVVGRLVFGTGKGIYQFNEKEKRFQPDPFFSALSLGYNPGECMVVADAGNNIWANAGKETALYRKMNDGNYRVEKGSPSRFADELLYEIYPENNANVWFGTTIGAICYETNRDEMSHQPFPAIIRSVKATDDSVWYNDGLSLENREKVKNAIPYRHNALTFEYAATYYIKPMDNEFQSMLEGFDKNWSAWNKGSSRNYTNLPHGHYTFRVKARNIFGEESTETSFAFTIRTPWYGSLWAYIGYILVAFLIVFGLVNFRTRKLRGQKLTLEKTVKKRTSQIRELSRIGRDITSSLSLENIIQIAYENVNNLMDASVFTIGLFKPEEYLLEFPATIKNHENLPPFSVHLDDENNLAAWCFNHRQEVIINDFEAEYGKYVSKPSFDKSEDVPESILFVPLYHKAKGIGVISAQSFKKNAYSDYHLNMLRNLAEYSAIALENANAYLRLSSLLDELKSAQDKLVTQSKLAALGTLTAGISHEIKNPLNFINNFAALNSELAQELEDKLKEEKGNLSPDNALEFEDIIRNLKENAFKIQEHGRRADSIVRSMLLQSKGGSGEWLPTDINKLLDEAINLTYHGMRAQDSGFNVKIEKSLDESIEKLKVVPQEISRAFLNIISNACYEAHRKKLKSDSAFMPALTVRTLNLGNQVKITIRDNGFGIPEKIRNKMFTPFFTTKPAGQGTGLGLSITYDIIVNKHKGHLTFETEEDNFTEFTILLPLETGLT